MAQKPREMDALYASNPRKPKSSSFKPNVQGAHCTFVPHLPLIFSPHGTGVALHEPVTALAWRARYQLGSEERQGAASSCVRRIVRTRSERRSVYAKRTRAAARGSEREGVTRVG